MGDDCAGGCQQALSELYNYLDGELTEANREAIRHHLDQCPPCGDAFGFESELRSVIARRCQESVPDALRQRIADAISREVRH